MATKEWKPVCQQHIQHVRFTRKQHGYRLSYLSLDVSGNIAASGCHRSGETYIDLFSRKKSDSRDRLDVFYSKEFKKYLNFSSRYVSLFDKSISKFVTCIGDRIDIIDTKNKPRELPSCKVSGMIMCLATKEEEIFIGLENSDTVLVFNNALVETKEIRVAGAECLRDLQVTKEKIFLCTAGRQWKGFSTSVHGGGSVSIYRDTTGSVYTSAYSIAVSEKLGLVSVVWGGRRIIVYSLNENKSILFFDVDYDVSRIRISSRDRTIVTANQGTGEIRTYSLGQLFCYETMKMTLSYLVAPEECEKLKEYYGVTEEEMNKLLTNAENTARRVECLLTIIEEKGHLTPYNIDTLTDAVSTLGAKSRVFDLKGPMEGYVLHSKNMTKKFTMAEMMTRQNAWEDERKRLRRKLETAECQIKEAQECEKTLKGYLTRRELTIEELEGKQITLRAELEQMQVKSAQRIDALTKELEKANQDKTVLTEEVEKTKLELLGRIKELETSNRDLELTKLTLNEARQDRDDIRTELKQCELNFAKESKALKEVINQVKEVMTEYPKRSIESEPFGGSEETKDEIDAVLAAEFGRMAVNVAEYLSLDHCLKLADIFKIPLSDCDNMYRVSYPESPGMKFLDILKNRNVINMFDITNLQKAIVMIQLEAVNHDVLEPYQEKIDQAQYEACKTEEIYTWNDVEVFVTNAVRNNSEQQKIRDISKSPHDDTEPGCSSQREVAGKDDKESHLTKIPCHLIYNEQSIGRRGGTIRLANITLTVPPDALLESHVIAINIMNESPFPLDRDADHARMTPLIKLDPLGLMFRKSVQLSIPHSALIPEPENHDIIIFIGQKTANDGYVSDSIRWTEDTSIPRKLKEKCVTVDIQCLSYLYASLMTKISAPTLHILRAVTFVDGVRNIDDDIALTICFCSDNDSQYNMLLSHYKSKLTLDEYITLQLNRHSERDEDDAGFLSVTVASANKTYIPYADQAVKQFPVSHLCTASRVSHQLRLQKNQEIDMDVVDIVLTFSQAPYSPKRIFLKARIKDLIISQESEDLLTDSSSTATKSYEKLKAEISGELDKDRCIQIATYFGLSPAESEKMELDAIPGKKLMEILDDREMIMPQKLFDLYEGLKICHLDKIARIVLKHLEKTENETEQERHNGEQERKNKCINRPPKHAPALQSRLQKQQKTSLFSLKNQTVQTTLSSSCLTSDVHVKTLTKEGYIEYDVLKALDISRNRLDTARKVLQCTEEPIDILATTDYIFLRKEHYIDENGGVITLQKENVHLVIPVGAFSKGNIVSLTMMTTKQGNVPSERRHFQISPVVKVGPEGLSPINGAILRIPHCVSETEGILSIDALMGFSSNDKDIHWRKRKQHEPAPFLKRDHVEVHLQTFCTICMDVTFDLKKPLEKRLRVLPLITRLKTPSNDLAVTLWFYNDDETEHMHLLQEEIIGKGKVQLHDFKSFALKGSDKDKEVHIESENNQITSNAHMKKLLSTTLWHNARTSVEFSFSCKESSNDINFRLKLCTRYFLRTFDELQFDLRVDLTELLQKPLGSIRNVVTTQKPHYAMEKAFQGLVGKLSRQLDMNTCLEMADIFRLSFDLKERVKKSNEPGKVFFDAVIQKQIIAAASVSALDVALTRTGHVCLAEDVKRYRHTYETFPTTVFTIL